MRIELEFDQEDDGRWIAEVPALPGVIAYGASRDDATKRVKALALRVIADKIENGEFLSALDLISFAGVVSEPVAVS